MGLLCILGNHSYTAIQKYIFEMDLVDKEHCHIVMKCRNCGKEMVKKLQQAHNYSSPETIYRCGYGKHYTGPHAVYSRKMKRCLTCDYQQIISNSELLYEDDTRHIGEPTCTSTRKCPSCHKEFQYSTDREHKYKPTGEYKSYDDSCGEAIKCENCGDESVRNLRPHAYVEVCSISQCVTVKKCNICGHTEEAYRHRWVEISQENERADKEPLTDGMTTTHYNCDVQLLCEVCGEKIFQHKYWTNWSKTATYSDPLSYRINKKINIKS